MTESDNSDEFFDALEGEDPAETKQLKIQNQ